MTEKFIKVRNLARKDPRNEFGKFENSFATKIKKHQLDSLILEIKSMVLKNYQLDYRKIVETSISSLAYSSYQNSNARSKTIDF